MSGRKFSWLERQIVVLALQASCGRALNVDGSSPSGHPKKRHRRKAMSFFCEKCEQETSPNKKSPVIQEITGLLHFRSIK